MQVEQTFVMVKPDGVARGLVGEILRRFENKGLKIRRLKMATIDPETAKVHYGHHADKPFFGELIEAITSGPVVMAVLEGPGAVAHVRNLIGATDPLKAAPGTIRGDFALQNPYNLVHASDSVETARQEIERFFGEA